MDAGNVEFAIRRLAKSAWGARDGYILKDEAELLLEHLSRIRDFESWDDQVTDDVHRTCHKRFTSTEEENSERIQELTHVVLGPNVNRFDTADRFLLSRLNDFEEDVRTFWGRYPHSDPVWKQRHMTILVCLYLEVLFLPRRADKSKGSIFFFRLYSTG